MPKHYAVRGCKCIMESTQFTGYCVKCSNGHELMLDELLFRAIRVQLHWLLMSYIEKFIESRSSHEKRKAIALATVGLGMQS